MSVDRKIRRARIGEAIGDVVAVARAQGGGEIAARVVGEGAAGIILVEPVADVSGGSVDRGGGIVGGIGSAAAGDLACGIVAERNTLGSPADAPALT